MSTPPTPHTHKSFTIQSSITNTSEIVLMIKKGEKNLTMETKKNITMQCYDDEQ